MAVGPELSFVLVIYGVKEIHVVGVEEYAGVVVHVDVTVKVKVKVGRKFPSSVVVALGKGVGEKKRRANASRVNARSRGVGVGLNLGTRIISPRVSGLPPAIITGKLNAMIQVPITTNRMIAPCDFTSLSLL